MCPEVNAMRCLTCRLGVCMKMIGKRAPSCIAREHARGCWYDRGVIQWPANEFTNAMPLAFAVVKDNAKIANAELRAAQEKEVMAQVDTQLGAIARPRRVYFVSALPKTRSGKLLRRSIQALAEGRDPGDLTTLEDPAALEQIRDVVKS